VPSSIDGAKHRALEQKVVVNVGSSVTCPAGAGDRAWQRTNDKVVELHEWGLTLGRRRFVGVVARVSGHA
jgi:hypothetical protein